MPLKRNQSQKQKFIGKNKQPIQFGLLSLVPKHIGVWIYIIFVAALVIFSLVVIFRLNSKVPPTRGDWPGGQKACTLEAKLCPDGSAVGRSGPNCEFAACPVVQSDPTASWLTYVVRGVSGDGLEFKYPESFGADIWRAFEWPPKVTTFSNSESYLKGCPNIPDNMLFEDNPVIINGVKYQLNKTSDAAAGSTYITYCYVTEKEQKYYVIQFVVRYATGCGENCGPYCGTEFEAVCQNFDKVNEVEKPIEQMLATFKISEPAAFSGESKIFRSQKLGFEFTYPSAWGASEEDKKVNFFETEENRVFSIELLNNLDTLGQSFCDSELAQEKLSNQTRCEWIQTKDKRAVVFDWTAGGMGYGIYSIDGKSGVGFSYFLSDKEILRKILASFSVFTF